MENADLLKFQDLTNEALAEKDLDRFIEILLERDRVAEGLLAGGPPLTEQTAGLLLEKEFQVGEKLEAERRGLLKEMEQLFSSIKAVRRYTPKFPFPSMPAFFDRAG